MALGSSSPLDPLLARTVVVMLAVVVFLTALAVVLGVFAYIAAKYR
ncbi:MAG: hypothetical protein ACXVXP_05855 [Mycobacteriaceae bacterium]